jgi:AraC-like DNA-binding protein
MVTLLDTDRLPPSERGPAQVAARLEAVMVSRVRFLGRRPPGSARLDVWDLGGLSVMRADLTGDLALSRSARQAREDAEPMVSFAVQELGVALQDHLDSRRVVPRGGLTLTEVASAYEYRWSGHGVCRALQLPVSRLGLPVDVVRRAVPLVRSSPLFGLVGAHLDQMTRDADVLAAEPLVHSLASATIDLTRALLASAVGPGRATDDALAGTTLTQVRSYVRQHLTEPGLGAEQVAAALAISVRQLYRLCSSARFSLEQWIIQQRLEGARAELADPGSRGRPIAAVARRWGFTDASYFSRRFRQAFDVSPRDWREADVPTPARPVPAPREEHAPAAAGHRTVATRRTDVRST